MNETIPPMNQALAKADLLFKPSSWLAKIDLIKHLSMFNNVLIAVCADVNSGKTTFIQLLRTEIDNKLTSQVLNAKPTITSNDLLLDMIEKFALPADSIATVADFVTYVNQHKINMLLIIDDAHYLPQVFLEECLIEIKKYGNHNFFHICVVSDFTLVPTLNALNMFVFENLIHMVVLGSLTENETKTYVMKNLTACDCLNKVVTEQRLHAFYHLTEGKIGAINREMAHYFDNKIVKSEKNTSIPIKKLGLIASFVIASLGVTYTWQHRENFFPTYKAMAQPEAIGQIVELLQPTEQILDLPLLSSIPALTVRSVKEPVISKSSQLTSIPKESSELIDSKDNSSEDGTFNEDVLINDVQINELFAMDSDNSTPTDAEIASADSDAAPVDSNVALEHSTDDDDASGALDSYTTKLELSDGDDSETAKLEEPLDGHDNLLNASIAKIEQQTLNTSLASIKNGLEEQLASLPLTKPAKAVTVKKTVVTPKPVVKPKRVISSKSVASVTSEAKGQFTIQLMASKSQSFIKEFINAHHVHNIAKIRQTKNNGINWYVLTVGNYVKREQAKDAIEQLPASLANLKPWIRAVTNLS